MEKILVAFAMVFKVKLDNELNGGWLRFKRSKIFKSGAPKLICYTN